MMVLKIGRRLTAEVASLKDASELYSRVRDQSGEGASTFPFGKVYENSKQVAEVSYNGRVWAPRSMRDWSPGVQPLYDNRGSAA